MQVAFSLGLFAGVGGLVSGRKALKHSVLVNQFPAVQKGAQLLVAQKVSVAAKGAGDLAVDSQAKPRVRAWKQAHFAPVHAFNCPKLARKAFRQILGNVGSFLADVDKRNFVCKSEARRAFAGQKHHLAHYLRALRMLFRRYRNFFVFVKRDVDFWQIDFHAAVFLSPLQVARGDGEQVLQLAVL